MDACGDVVDTSDAEEKEILKTRQPDYYEKAWGKVQKISDNDEVTSEKRPVYRTPSTTPSSSRHTISSPIRLLENIAEDLIPYSYDSVHRSTTLDTFAIPDPVPDIEPDSSQDPICLFAFSSSPHNAALRSRTPLTPLKITSPVGTLADNSEEPYTQNKDQTIEFVTGSSTEVLNVLQPQTPWKSLSSSAVPFNSSSPLSPLSLIHPVELAEEFTEASVDLNHHHPSEHDQFPPTSSSPRPQPSSSSLPSNDKDLRHGENQSLDVDENRSYSPFVDPGPLPRQYSLRNRSAKQLNPFEYDSRQYKRLLRHIPEAIVRKTLLQNAHKEQDDDWVESQNVEQEESQVLEALGNENDRRRRLEQRRAMDRLFKELNLSLSSSDEDLDLENQSGKPVEPNHGDDTQQPRGKKRKRAVRPFPLRIPEMNQLNGQEPQNIPPVIHSPYHSPRHSPLFPEVNPEFDLPYGEQFRPPSSAPGSLQNHDTEWKSISPLPSDHESVDGVLSSRRGKRLRRGPRSHDGSDIVIVEEPNLSMSKSTPGSDSESSNSSKHQLMAQEKILRRFLPAGVVKKFLEQDKQATRRPKVQNGPNKQADDDVVRPGHGRKRIVSPNSRDPSRYQIHGDAESETDSPPQSNFKEVIEISDEALSEGEENIESLERDSEGTLDEDELQHWLIRDPTVDESDVGFENNRRISLGRHPNRIDHEPELIDRMLQRTRRVGIIRSSEGNKGNGRRAGTTNRVKDSHVTRARPKKLHQTKLTFDRVGRISNKAKPSREYRSPSIRMHSPSCSEAEVQQAKKTPQKKPYKRHKRVRPSKYQNVYFTRNNGFNITSGRPRPRPVIQVNLDDEEFHAALVPENSRHKSEVPGVHRNRRTSDLIRKYQNATNADREEFDPDGPGPLVQKITLDLGIQPIPAGLTVNREGYIGRGRLFELVAFLNASAVTFESPPVFSFPDISLDPHKTMAEMSMDITSLFDKLFNASIMPLEITDAPNNIVDMQRLSYALRQLVTHKVLHADEDEANHTMAFISEQTRHLLARIDEKLEAVSADGHSLDFRSFSLYWLAVELHLRMAYGRRRRPQTDDPSHLLNTHGAEEYAVQLLRRLLEYDPGRIIEPLQRDGLMFDKSSPDMRVLEYWICLFHVSTFLHSATTSPGSSFWRLIESALELQSNKPDSPLAQSERIWKTVFMVNTFSQFSMEGMSRSLVRVDAHWPIIIKVLQSIRLNADPQKDNSKPAAMLQKRDAYLRLVTARCYLLSSQWQWDTNDAEEVFRELYSIFRSREFGNLLGEPDDFPSFIRDRDEALCHAYSTTDTAYSVFLKLVIRTVRNFHGDERSRATKITRLLSLIVPVGATSFSKTSPPLHNDLSKLYNRYTAVYVAIYVDPSEKHIRSRLQQVRRYVNFKGADLDSRMAAIRAMMNISILLRHLRKSLSDILLWASEMIGDLLVEYGESQAENPTGSDASRVILLVQTVLGTLRFIMNTPTLDRLAPTINEYPDITYLQVWMPQVLSSSLVKDHRTGLEICSCFQKFLEVRANIFPLPAIPKPRLEESEESQDYYEEYDLDMDDPTLLALFDQSEPANENYAADQRASEVLNTFSSKLYSCVCLHLGCHYREIDAWLESWLGFGKVLIQNRKKEWDYYLKLGESAWQDIKDPFRRTYIRLRCMMTVLKLDPNSYKTHARDFLRLGLEALLTPKITLEHEYYGLLLCVDNLSHPLLKQMPCTLDPTSGLFNLDKSSFLDKRIEFIAKIFHNASSHMKAFPTADILYFVEVILTTLHQWKNKETLHDNDLRTQYEKFAEETLALARSHDVFCDQLTPFTQLLITITKEKSQIL